MIRKDHSDRAITDRVIQARKEARMTKTDLAARLGMTKQGYYHYENYDVAFSVQQLFQLAKILNHSVEYFLGLDIPLTDQDIRMLAMYRQAEEKGLGGLALDLVRSVAGTPVE